MYLLYTLSDPRDNSIRYVGYTSSPSLRFEQHCQDRSKTHKCHWISALRAKGLKPTMQIVAQSDSVARIKLMEVKAIAALRASGVKLTNTTAGGDGGRDRPSAAIRTTRNMLHNLLKTAGARA